MTRFIFKGWYYPVIGSNNGWVNYNTRQIIEKRIGGWENADKWWSFSIGIKCKLTNPKKPHFQFVIDAIEDHPEMKIVQEYFDDSGTKVDKSTPKSFKMTSVMTLDNKYIGNISDAYFLTEHTHLEATKPEHSTVSIGYLHKERKWCGWSHRAKACFGVGDRIFEEDYGDECTLYTQHGHETIVHPDEAKQAAINFARYIS
jgi:hypothetical protein